MNPNPRIDEASEILRHLAMLPGTTMVNLIAKKFPRIAPAEARSGYVHEERSFTLAQLPDELPVSGDMDEIVMTLQGPLDAAESPVAVMILVDSAVSSVRAGARWDSRTSFRSDAGGKSDYQITVFSDAFCTVPGT